MKKSNINNIKDQIEKLKGGLGQLETEHLAEQPPFFSIHLANNRTHITTNPEELYWFYKLNGTGTKEPPKSRGGKSKGARNKGKKKVTRTRDERE